MLVATNRRSAAYRHRADTAILDMGGKIDKHIGDAVMALFGAPVAHEDDPERAIRAALRMQAELARFRPPATVLAPDRPAPILRMRIGINTGPVLLGAVGTTDRVHRHGRHGERRQPPGTRRAHRRHPHLARHLAPRDRHLRRGDAGADHGQGQDRADPGLCGARRAAAPVPHDHAGRRGRRDADDRARRTSWPGCRRRWRGRRARGRRT